MLNVFTVAIAVNAAHCFSLACALTRPLPHFFHYLFSSFCCFHFLHKSSAVRFLHVLNSWKLILSEHENMQVWYTLFGVTMSMPHCYFTWDWIHILCWMFVIIWYFEWFSYTACYSATATYIWPHLWISFSTHPNLPSYRSLCSLCLFLSCSFSFGYFLSLHLLCKCCRITTISSHQITSTDWPRFNLMFMYGGGFIM